MEKHSHLETLCLKALGKAQPWPGAPGARAATRASAAAARTNLARPAPASGCRPPPCPGRAGSGSPVQGGDGARPAPAAGAGGLASAFQGELERRLPSGHPQTRPSCRRGRRCAPGVPNRPRLIPGPGRDRQTPPWTPRRTHPTRTHRVGPGHASSGSRPSSEVIDASRVTSDPLDSDASRVTLDTVVDPFDASVTLCATGCLASHGRASGCL